MLRESVQTALGLLILLTHVLSFFGIVFWQSYISSDDRLDVAMLLFPITAAYFVAIVRSAITRQDVVDTVRKVTTNYLLIVGVTSVAFCLALLSFVFGYPSVGGPTTVELRRWLILLEIAFGSGFGLIAEDLFGKVERVAVPESTRNANR